MRDGAEARGEASLHGETERLQRCGYRKLVVAGDKVLLSLVLAEINQCVLHVDQPYDV